jgi:hypothetical protein
MPQMANITIKNSADADVVFSAATPSSGDKSPAQWTSNSASATIGNRPKFGVQTRDNSRGNGRVLEINFNFPILQTIAGVETVVARVPLTASGTLPTNVDASKVSEAFLQFGNLISSDLIREAMADGYAPT